MNEWWRGGVIYQIYPRSFQDSDGDGVGDLPGIIRRIDHVASLGVDAVWLAPFFASPMDDMGYDVSDYTSVDPLFGSLEDFDSLVAHAHDRGLKVIIDQVLSHTSDRHAWFRESRVSRTNARADWYVWADPRPDGTPPNNWPSVFGGPAWEWNGARQQYYLHNFLASQADLNFHNPAVQDALLDVMRFWLERGVDGFRFDTVNYYFHDEKLRDNPPAEFEEKAPLEMDPYGRQEHLYSKNRPDNVDFLRRIRALLDEFPGTMTVGEVGDSEHMALTLMAEYTNGPDLLHMCYSFDMLSNNFSPVWFRSRVETFFRMAPDGWPCWSFSNHDVRRHVSRWQRSGASREALARLSAALLFTLKGTICIYQGEELGLPEAELEYEELTDPPGIRFWPENKGRDGCRTPMPWEEGPPPNGFTTGKPWLPVKPPHDRLSVARQDADDLSVLAFYRRALAFRRDHAALKTGDVTFLDSHTPVLAFCRAAGSDRVVCVFNLSPEPASLTATGLRLASVEDALSSECAVSGGELSLGPNGFLIAELAADVQIEDIVVSQPSRSVS